MRHHGRARHAAVLAAPVVLDIAGPLAALALLSAGVGLLVRREIGRSPAHSGAARKS